MATFGEILKQLRKDAGKSQVEAVKGIAAMFPGYRMSQTTLSALETSESAPRQEVLQVLAQYYRVPITHFFQDRPENADRVAQAKLWIRALRRMNIQAVDYFDMPDDEYWES